MSDSASTDTDADQDLRDVFRLMYDEDEDDWAVFDEVSRPVGGCCESADSRTSIHL
jgi:hypothetical protein